MNLRQRLISASALNVLDYGLKIGVVLVVSPIMIRQLGKETYGWWVLLLSLVGYLELLDLGFSQTCVRYLSRLNSPKQVEDHAKTFKWFLKLYNKLAIIVLAISLAAYISIPIFLKDFARSNEIGRVIGLGGLMMAITFHLRPFGALLKSQVLYHKIIVAGIIRLIISSVLLLVALYNRGGLTSLALAWVVGAATEQVVIWIFAKRLKQKAKSNDSLDPQTVKELSGFALKTFGGAAGAFMRDRFDTQIIAAHLGTAFVTNYSVGTRLIAIFSDLMNAIFGSHFMAAFSKSDAEKGRAAASEQLMATLYLSCPLALIGGALIFTFGPSFIQIWLGHGFEESHLVTKILAFPIAFSLMLYPCGFYLGALNRHGMLATISILGATMNLILSIVLVKTLGFVGPVVATALELTLLAFLWIPWLLTHYGDIGVKQIISLITRNILAVAVPTLVSFWIVAKLGQPRTLLELVLAVLGSATALLISSFFFGLPSCVRIRILKRLPRE